MESKGRTQRQLGRNKKAVVVVKVQMDRENEEEEEEMWKTSGGEWEWSPIIAVARRCSISHNFMLPSHS